MKRINSKDPNSKNSSTRYFDNTSTLSTTVSTKIRSSLSSSEASESEYSSIWRAIDAKTAAKTIQNRTDSYKLAFPLSREQAEQKENTIPNTIRSQLKNPYIEGTSNLKCSSINLKGPDPKPRQKLQTKKLFCFEGAPKDFLPPFKKSPVESIYAPKRANKTTDTVPKKPKSVFCKQSSASKPLKELQDDAEKDVNQKVLFSQYDQLNDRLERLENHLNSEQKKSEDSNELRKIKSESLDYGHSSWQEVTHHPIADPITYQSPAPREHRLQIHTEILQYFVLYGIIMALGIIMIAMTSFWVFMYQGGFSDLINLHIVLSIMGFVQTTQGLLVIRTTRYVAKESTSEVANILHTIVHSTALAVDSISIAMAFVSGSLTIPPSNNMHTLHAWIGIITYALYFLLLLLSLSFFFPRLQFIPMRIAISIHVALGMTVFFMLLSACLSGFLKEVMWTLEGTYVKFHPAGVLVNCIVVSMMVYCGIFIYILRTVKDF